MYKIEHILKEIKPELDFLTTNNFIVTGILDSFDIILLVAAMEEKFGVRIEGIDIVPENFDNIEAISNLLQKYQVAQ